MRTQFTKWIQRKHCILLVPPLLCFLVFIGSTSNISSDFLPVPVQCKDGICEKIQVSEQQRSWNGEPSTKSNFHIEANRDRDKRMADPRSTVSPVATKKPAKEGGNKVDIVIWTTSNLTSLRKKRLEGIRYIMNRQKCFAGCRLAVSRDQKLANKADALVFFMFTIGFERKELPRRGGWNQIWVYNQHEPLANYKPKPYLNGLFNWTMTYRQDADIYQPYYKKQALKTPIATIYVGERNQIPLQDWIRGKTEFGTAVISHCNTKSKREIILKSLQAAGIPIDIYGKCGNETFCPRYDADCKQSWQEHATKYKFFFAFENSLCSDYITEKFWRSLKLGMVPVVLGRGQYLEMAPPHSYIDIRDYSTPQELKRYLEQLDGDPNEYAKYFEWRKRYSIRNNLDDFCHLCEKLREHKRMVMEGSSNHSSTGHQSYSKSYNDLVGWLGTEPGHPGKPACITPTEVGLGNFIK